MDILEMTIEQIDRALRAGILTKYDILAAATTYGATDTVLNWLSARIV